MKHNKSAAGFALLAAFFLAANSALGGEFNINPIRVYLDGKTRSGTVVVENLGDEVLTVQATMNSWTQEDGKEDLIAPTEDLLVSPPIFKVQPKSKQTVRIANLKKPDPKLEGAYRLYLQEVPPPRKPDEPGMSVAVRISLPIFIAPSDAKAQAAVKWKAEPIDAKNIRLILANSGNAHIQINGISVNLPDGASMGSIPSMMTYILPGQSHTFKIKTDKPWNSEPLRVMIKSDTAPPGVETEVKPE
jgi:fimbrial chaperone protein